MTKGVYSKQSLSKRFWEKVDVKGLDECWEWTGAKQLNGYGVIGDGKKMTYAHRVAWKLHNGLIPDGLWVLHCCDNKACVNPAHLFLGTHADNMADMLNKNRQAKGERQGNAKLTEKKVHEIRALLVYGLSQRVIGKKYNVVHNTIGRIKTGANWGWLT